MADISKDQSDEFKEIVLNFLHGEPISLIAGRLKYQCIEFNKGCTSLYKAITVEPTDPFIIAILGSLNIKQSRPGEAPQAFEELMKSDNLHELLTLLSHDGHRQISYLLKIIENTQPKRNWTLLLMLSTISSAGAGAFFYINKPYFDAISDWFLRTFPFVIDWLKKTFSVLRNIPLLLIIYNGFGLIWSWYNTFTNGTTTSKEKLNALFFETFSASLTISAYILSFYSAGAVTVPVALLFVLSASIALFQSVFHWIKSKQAMNELTRPTITSHWEIVAEYKRAFNLHQLTINSVYIKLAAAILTTIAVGIWNFFPPALLITIFCACFTTLTDLTARSILSNREETSANQLQKTIKNIKTIPGVELRPSNKDVYYSLEEKELELKLWEASLYQRQLDFEALQQYQKESLESCDSPPRALQRLSKSCSVPARAANDAEEIGIVAAGRRKTAPVYPTNTSKFEPVVNGPGYFGMFGKERRQTEPLVPTGISTTLESPIDKQLSLDL